MTDTETPSPRRRAVFLDVDGTYAVFGAAPAGHVAAVRAAPAGRRASIAV